MSSEHTLYLKIKNHKKILILFFRILILLVFIIGWELLSRFNIINSFLSSSPSKVIKTIYKLSLNGELFKHIFITLYEVFVSFSIATILGLFISIVLWSNSSLAKIIDPYLTVLNSLPKVALGPLIIIWVGADMSSIIFMALLINLFITIINIYNGFVSTNKNYIILLKSFKATKKQIFLKAVLPSNYITIINSLKINISMSLIGVIMGELLVSKSGLGYLIMYGSQVFNIDLVITSVVILGIISYLMYFILEKIELNIQKKKN